MADGDPKPANLGPQTATSGGPPDRELAGPAPTTGRGAPIAFAVGAVYYGFWIFVSIATGRDLSALRWAVPLMLLGPVVCVLGYQASRQLDRLSKYSVAKGRPRVGSAASLICGVVMLFMVLGGVATFVGFVGTIVTLLSSMSGF